MIFELPRVLPITDTQLSGLSHAEQVRQLIAGGATLIQIRDKTLAPRELYYEARAALSIARARGVQVIINDRADLALALGADGVHLGQSDVPPEAARRLLGDRAIIGYSTHNLEQAKIALKSPINYLAIGPIFRTSSKKNPDPVVGLETIRAVRNASKPIPLVAIGGITAANAPEVFAAGANSVAMIGELFGGAPLKSKFRELLDLGTK